MIVADDEVLLREGMVGLLEQRGYDVVGQAGDGSELIRLVREHQPDLAIVDIRMPPTHSTEELDAASAIRDEFPETAILILSAHIEVAHAMTLLGSGRRSGYLLKSRVRTQLVPARAAASTATLVVPHTVRGGRAGEEHACDRR